MDTITKLVNLNELGVSQTILAQYSNCHKTTIGKIINGKYHPSKKTLILIDEGINKLYYAINQAIFEAKEDNEQ